MTKFKIKYDGFEEAPYYVSHESCATSYGPASVIDSFDIGCRTFESQRYGKCKQCDKNAPIKIVKLVDMLNFMSRI